MSIERQEIEYYLSRYESIADGIEGWYGYPGINPVLRRVNEIHYQKNVVGNMVEIGIHHGKSFIPLACFLREKEIAIAIDCFDDQEFNVDFSGKGGLEEFLVNIERVFLDSRRLHQIRILKSNSLELSEKTILDYGSRVRIFSIDGGHTVDTTLNDMQIASDSLNELGIMILDDYMNPEWPGVRYGIDKFLHENKSWTPFYIGSNKMFICQRGAFDTFRSLENEDMKNQRARAKIAGLWE